MNIIVGEIRVKRGLKANLPVLKEGEPAYCTDTKEYYIGTPEGNVLVGSQTSGGDTGGGGSVPSNVILFEDWVDGETVTIDTSTTPPADTTAPVLTITAGGTFTGTKTVTLSVNETADIFYTLDGSTPTTASTKYTAPLSISATTTLKAFARDTAGNVSTVQTVTYTLDTTTPADTTAPDNVTNLQATPTANSVALSWTASASSDVASYDIYNGSTLIGNVTGTTFNVTGLTASTTYTFSVRAKDGANNVASGTTVTTTTLAPVDTTAPTLTITPAATFSDTQAVTMTANETATIWYTVDGSDPITSGTRVQYTAPVTLTATTTVKAYAVDSANNVSAVQTVTYTKETVPTGNYVTDGLTLYVDGMTQSEVRTISPHDSYFVGSGEWTYVTTGVFGANADFLRKRIVSNTANASQVIKLYRSAEGKFILTAVMVDSTGANMKVNTITTGIYSSFTDEFHVAVRKLSDRVELYINNVKYDHVLLSSSTVMNNPTGTQEMLIGNNITGTWGPVKVNNALYYNRVLTIEELTQNFNNL